ncbi:MAG: ribonuclease PH [Bdellovibrionota bacterium]
MIQREPAGRQSQQIRPLSFEIGATRYAEGSVFAKSGHTHVLCNVSIEPSVPAWLVGKGQGWVTAEYSMLPRSTHTRSKRDREKISGRTHEIQRLIGRALRSMVNMKALGEKSILVDCDVIQADGGTRTTAINGACVALIVALEKLQKSGVVSSRVWTDTVSAVSIGLKSGEALVDLDYNEDSSCDVDMNFVLTGSGGFVEVQGTAEKEAFQRKHLDLMTDAAVGAAKKIRELQVAAVRETGITLD